MTMSTEGAPEARGGHVAFWTGAEMVVWGGFRDGVVADDSIVFADGGRYRPDEDRWAPMSTAGAPSVRAGFSATWAGTKLFVWGGEVPAGGEGEEVRPAFGDGALYDPLTDTWSPIAAEGAPDARFLAHAVWTGHEVLVWGGVVTNADFDTVPQTSGAAYDVDREVWRPMSSDGAPVVDRPWPAAAWTGHELLVFDFLDSPQRGGGRYDPAADAWSPINPAGAPEQPPCGVVWTGTQVIAVHRDSGLSTYDPTTDEWQNTPTAESLCGVPVWADDRILSWAPLWGPAYQMNPASLAVSPMTETGQPTARGSHSAVWTGTEMIVWGGEEDGGTFTNTGARYTP
jgi:hypothetical protein